ncbi:MAG TPA: hypothetical protein VNM47_03145 [Terriglobia bacterium]|nr:hypothetical protein [Terriglobia bacterium]
MRYLQGLWIVLLMFVATSAWAADVSGKWTGSMVLNAGRTDPANVQLKQNGKVVSGTMGPSDEKQFPLSSGRVDGDMVTIEAKPGPSVLRLTMRLEGTKLSGEVFEDNQEIGTVSLQKASQ